MGGLLQVGRALDNPATAELFIVAGLLFLLIGGLGHIAITIQADRAERAVTGVLGLILIGAGLLFLHRAASAPLAANSAQTTGGASASTAPTSTVAATVPSPTAPPTLAPATPTTAPAPLASATLPPGPTAVAAATGASTTASVAAVASPAVAAPGPPTATAVPLPKCPSYPVRGFGLVYRSNSDVAFRLGCAAAPEVGVPASQETFEHGVMIKPANGQLIYVVRADGSWKSYPDTYQTGEALTAVGGIPANLLAPDHGFGKLWRDQSDVRQALGWATGPEQALQGAVEPFTAGQMLWTSDRKIYVLFADGSGRSFNDQFVDATTTPG